MQHRAIRLVTTVLVLLASSGRGSAQAVEPAAVAPQPDSPARAQVAAHEIAQLDAALSSLAELSENSPVGGVVTILSGGVVIASGAYLALAGSDSEDDGDQAVRGIASAYVMAMGGVTVASGLRLMDGRSTDARRLARFRAVVARGGMDALTFARFEGGLIAESEIARQMRISAGFTGLGFAAGGAGALTIALAAQDIGDDSRLWLGIAGGTYVLWGLWQGFVSLTGETQYEQIAREYARRPRRAGSPAPRAPSVALSPSASRGGIGLALLGSF